MLVSGRGCDAYLYENKLDHGGVTSGIQRYIQQQDNNLSPRLHLHLSSFDSPALCDASTGL